MKGAWALLKVTHSPQDLPPMLYRYETGTSSYCLTISDLTQCWRETLDRRQIIKRSFELDTSIDPSESAEQLRIFLASTEDGFLHNGDASLEVQSYDGEQIELTLAHPLPGSLAPLKWRFLLEKQNAKFFSEQMVLPMFRQRLMDQSALSSLRRIIKEKDHVISRLFGAIQTNGVSLNGVFPGFPLSKSMQTKSISRQALGKIVQEMSEFDDIGWEINQKEQDVTSGSPEDIVEKLFSASTEVPDDCFHALDLTKWRQKILNADRFSMSPSKRKQIAVDVSSRESTSQPNKVSKADTDRLTSSLNVQQNVKANTLPLHLSRTENIANSVSTEEEGISSSAISKKLVDEDASTTDESSEKERAQSGQPHQSKNHPAATGDPTSTATPGLGGQLDDDDDGEAPSEPLLPPVSDAPAPSPAAKGKKNKIGKIGGKKQTDVESPVQQLDANKSDSKPLRNKLRSQRGPSPEPTSKIHGLSDERLKRDKAPQPRQENTEVSDDDDREERANRKREALKRELEAKSHATAKKKRRF